MKKTILLIVFVTLAAFVSVAIAAAPPKASTTTPAAPATTKKEVKTEKFDGEIKSVDAKAMSIVVAKEKVEKTFSLDEMAKITKGRKDFPFADLKAGLSVKVKYKMNGNKAIAITIKVQKSKAK